ncbi:hypothetical protein ACQJBY_045504 [Aegilops geniculata]
MAPTLPLMWCPGNKNKSRHGLYLDPVFARPDRWISLWSARRGSPAAARKWAGTRPSAAKANLSKVLPATFQKITGNICKQPLFVIVLFHVAPLMRGRRVLVVVADEKKGNHQAGDRGESCARSLEARQPGAITEERGERGGAGLRRHRGEPRGAPASLHRRGERSRHCNT